MKHIQSFICQNPLLSRDYNLQSHYYVIIFVHGVHSHFVSLSLQVIFIGSVNLHDQRLLGK
uniref:Uncharacterized protein n=1 Tax=Arundo donax TaxID=35708 RepID=A0A0A9H163_ARUDO